MGPETTQEARAGKEARAAVMGHVWAERDRQDGLWPEQAPGEQLHPDHTMLAVLTEEVGEVAKATLEGNDPELRTELIQVAAVCVKWAEIIALAPPEAENGEAPTDRECGAAITDPGGDGSGWG